MAISAYGKMFAIGVISYPFHTIFSYTTIASTVTQPALFTSANHTHLPPTDSKKNRLTPPHSTAAIYTSSQLETAERLGISPKECTPEGSVKETKNGSADYRKRAQLIETSALNQLSTNRDILNQFPDCVLELSEQELLDHGLLHNKNKKSMPALTGDEQLLIQHIQGDIQNFFRIPSEYLTETICMEAVKIRPDLIEKVIPTKHQTDTVRWIAAIKNGKYIRYIDKTLQTDQLYEYVALQGNLHIKDVPTDRLTKKLLHIIIENNGSEIKFLSESQITDEIRIKAYENDHRMFRYLPSHYKTLERCRDIVTHFGGEFLQYIPKDKRKLDICLTALQSYGEAITFFPKEFIKKEYYELAIERTPSLLISSEHQKNIKNLFSEKERYQLYLHFVEKGYDFLLEEMPDTFKTRDLYMRAFISPLPLKRIAHHLKHNIPDTIKDASFFSYLYSRMMIEKKDIPKDYRENLKQNPSISLLNTQDNPYTFSQPFYHEHFLNEEIKETSFTIDKSVYQSLFQLIQESKNHTKLHPNIKKMNDTHLRLLKKSVIFGGRTLRNGTQFFKFLRKDEVFYEFILESKVVNYLSQHKVEFGLKSDIPQPSEIVKLAKTPETEEWIRAFKDPPDTTQNPNERIDYYIVYPYTAHENYSKFAHETNPESPTPCKDAEQGLLKGIHDVGIMARKGILYIHALPAFHNTAYQREWILMGGILKGFESPGSLTAWCNQSTDYPNYGYSGLRDLADFSLVGLTTHYINLDSERAHKSTSWLMIQKASYFNAINENILATVLLYARLHRQSHSYHHDDQETMKNTSAFIDAILTSFLRGYFHNDTLLALDTMALDSERYHQWLDIVSKRLIYWTEKQSSDGNCYTRDLLTTHHFNTDIYPNGPALDTLPSNLDPEKGFVDPLKNPNLGGPNKVFPLMHFLEGLAFLNRQMNKQTVSQKNLE